MTVFVTCKHCNGKGFIGPFPSATTSTNNMTPHYVGSTLCPYCLGSGLEQRLVESVRKQFPNPSMYDKQKEQGS